MAREVEDAGRAFGERPALKVRPSVRARAVANLFSRTDPLFHPRAKDSFTCLILFLPERAHYWMKRTLCKAPPNPRITRSAPGPT
jgi:hypothetical protein